MKIVRGKIFSSLRVSDKNFLTKKYLKLILQHISHKDRHIMTIEYNFERDHYRGASYHINLCKNTNF